MGFCPLPCLFALVCVSCLPASLASSCLLTVVCAAARLCCRVLLRAVDATALVVHACAAARLSCRVISCAVDAAAIAVQGSLGAMCTCSSCCSCCASAATVCEPTDCATSSVCAASLSRLRPIPMPCRCWECFVSVRLHVRCAHSGPFPAWRWRTRASQYQSAIVRGAVGGRGTLLCVRHRRHGCCSRARGRRRRSSPLMVI